jgi:plastocyanin
MLTTRLLIAATTISVLSLSACGSDGGTTSDDPSSNPATDAGDSASPSTAMVDLTNSRFDPSDVVIAAGDIVTFTNNDPYAHTVTSADDSAIEFDSGEIGQAVQFEQTFDVAGTYDFFCRIHPTMRGTVTVD